MGNYPMGSSPKFMITEFVVVTPAVWSHTVTLNEAKESIIRYVISGTDSVILTLVKH